MWCHHKIPPSQFSNSNIVFSITSNLAKKKETIKLSPKPSWIWLWHIKWVGKSGAMLCFPTSFDVFSYSLGIHWCTKKPTFGETNCIESILTLPSIWKWLRREPIFLGEHIPFLHICHSNYVSFFLSFISFSEFWYRGSLFSCVFLIHNRRISLNRTNWQILKYLKTKQLFINQLPLKT